MTRETPLHPGRGRNQSLGVEWGHQIWLYVWNSSSGPSISDAKSWEWGTATLTHSATGGTRQTKMAIACLRELLYSVCSIQRETKVPRNALHGKEGLHYIGPDLAMKLCKNSQLLKRYWLLEENLLITWKTMEPTLKCFMNKSHNAEFQFGKTDGGDGCTTLGMYLRPLYISKWFF